MLGLGEEIVQIFSVTWREIPARLTLQWQSFDPREISLMRKSNNIELTLIFLSHKIPENLLFAFRSGFLFIFILKIVRVEWIHRKCRKL